MPALSQDLQRQLTILKLAGVREALIQQLQQPQTYSELSFIERLEVLLTHELTQREQRRIERLIRQARFREPAELSRLEYHPRRHLDKAQVRELQQPQWLNQAHNLIITGPTGCGKTYLACALGRAHCRQNISTYYIRLKQLLEQMYLAQADGSYRKLVERITKTQSLIIDDWGLEPLNANQRSDLLELIDARYNYHSTTIISQLPIDLWYDMIGESTHADAILDRLVHRAIKVELRGESMRKSKNILTDGDQAK